jgi:hypothetical protein
MKPSPQKPRIILAQVDGSGTAADNNIVEPVAVIGCWIAIQKFKRSLIIVVATPVNALTPIPPARPPGTAHGRNHRKIEGLEQAHAHQRESCFDRVPPFGLCMRMATLISALRISSRSFWRSRYCFATPASEDLSARLVSF